VSYGTTRPIPGTTITAMFEDGQLRGSAGCNSYFGSYQVSGDKIRVGDLALTEMACLEPAGLMEQELVFAEFMRDAQSFRLVDGRGHAVPGELHVGERSVRFQPHRDMHL